MKRKTLSILCLLSFMPLVLGGCASGGFKATRKVAAWNNSLNILLRIPVYLAFLFFPVYGTTLVLDAIIFNTIDFWSGTVSATENQFEKDGLYYAVEHLKTPLRHTKVTVSNSQGQVLEVFEIRENSFGQMEVWVNQSQKTSFTIPFNAS